jgi:hypothetical protein
MDLIVVPEGKRVMQNLTDLASGGAAVVALLT